MSLNERLYHLKCGIFSARVMPNPLDQLERYQQARIEQREIVQELQELHGKHLSLSGQTNGYLFTAPSMAPRWIVRPWWIELQPVLLGEVSAPTLRHPKRCIDIYVATKDQPYHWQGLCLMNIETLDPVPAWVSA